MAKKQTRRSISVNRGVYERLKAYCEVNRISMSKFVEERVGDFLGRRSLDDLERTLVAPKDGDAASADQIFTF